MIKRMVGFLTIGLLLGAMPADDSKRDLEKLAGEWTMESAERDGDKVPEEFARSLKRTVKGDEYIISRDGEELSKGKFKLDASKKPKEIDLTPSSGPAEGQTIKGIYELDGDTFKICYGPPEGERPKEFAAPAGSGNTLAVWKRDKK